MGNMKRLVWIAALVALVALPLLAAAPRNGGDVGSTSKKPSVSIKDMKFDPASIDVKVGETVTWTNEDDRDHSVVAKDGTFDSDNIRPGKTYSYKFTKPGKFSYSCEYHPRMKGTVNVADGK